MMKKLTGINNNQILDIALKEAKEICDEDENFCENIGINGLKLIEEIYIFITYFVSFFQSNIK